MKRLPVLFSLSLILCFASSINAQIHSGQSESIPIAAPEYSETRSLDSGFTEGWSGCSCTSGDWSGGGWSRPRHFYRSQPPGTLTQHYPYDAFRMYYYDRPYNAHHVDQRVNHPVSQFAPKHLPYSHKVFESVYDQIEPRIIEELHLRYSDLTTNETIPEQIARDRNLEYVDWPLHRDRRIVWEREKAEQKLRQTEPETRLESQPVSNPALKFAPDHTRQSPIQSDSGENSR